MARRQPNLNAKVFAIPLGSMFVMVALTLVVAFFNDGSFDDRSRAADVYPTVTPFFTPVPPTPTPTPTPAAPIAGSSCVVSACLSRSTFYYCQPGGTYAAPITCKYFCDGYDDPSRGCNCPDPFARTLKLYPPYAKICHNNKEWVCDWRTGAFYQSIRKCN